LAFGFFSYALASAVAKVDFEHFYVSLIFQEFRFPFFPPWFWPHLTLARFESLGSFSCSCRCLFLRRRRRHSLEKRCKCRKKCALRVAGANRKKQKKKENSIENPHVKFALAKSKLAREKKVKMVEKRPRKVYYKVWTETRAKERRTQTKV